MPPVEQFANNAATTLSGAISAGATSLVLASATGFPATGNFRLLIDSEIFLCTARSGTTCTVTPGAEGSTQAAHLAGAAVTSILTAGAMQTVQQVQVAPISFTRVTNTANSIYAIDTTSGFADYLILHNKAGPTSYVLPSPTDGRNIKLRDLTNVIGFTANSVFIVPHASERINNVSALSLSGTAYNFTNGSLTVTATGSQFTTELAVGMSIQSSNQPGVNYIVSAIGSNTSLTLSAAFTGTTTSAATTQVTSVIWSANGSKLDLDCDGTNWYEATLPQAATNLLSIFGSDLVCWLRGDLGRIPNGSQISQWTDQSGHNRHAVQATPAMQPGVGTLSGQAAITFASSRTQALSMPLDFPVGAKAIYIVYQMTTIPVSSDLAGLITIVGSGLLTDIMLTRPGTGYMGMTFAPDNPHITNPAVGFPDILDTAKHIIGISYNGGTRTNPANFTASYDNVTQTVAASSSVSRTATDLSCLGGWLSSTNVLSQGLIGAIAEVGVVGIVPSSAQDTAARAYLAARYP